MLSLRALPHPAILWLTPGDESKLDEDWDYACDAALGGSDCSYTIPVEWLELAVEQGFQEFRLRMSETNIKLVSK